MLTTEKDIPKAVQVSGTINDGKKDISDNGNDSIESPTKKVEESRIKGELESELKLEISFASTEPGAYDSKRKTFLVKI